jgi:hypothetical protein
MTHTKKKMEVTLIQLQDMPDEILLKTFKCLDRKNLLRCSKVSRRFRKISQDDSLWQKVNLCRKTVPCEFLQTILKNGCKYLSLYDAKLEGRLDIKERSKLRYLDLSFCKNVSKVYKELLTSCCNLEKLSLHSSDLFWSHPNFPRPMKTKVLQDFFIQNGKSLKILNLIDCKGLTIETISTIATNCTELTELNLDGTYLSEESMNILSKNLSPKMEQLSLYGIRFANGQLISKALFRVIVLTKNQLSKDFCPSL